MTTEERDAKNQAIQKATETIEEIVDQCSVLAVKDQPVLIQTIRMARGMQQLRNVLSESAIKSDFMPLKNTALGFLTDENPEKNIVYGWEQVRECVIEALLRGFRPINNEFNIISGRFYGAKNGFERIVREYPGLSDLAFDLGVPVMVADKGALVAFETRWVLYGEAMELSGRAPTQATPNAPATMDTRIPVRVNAGMTPDAILGKATRKMFARIYQRLTGCAREIVDAEPGEVVGVVVPAQALPAPAEPAKDGQRISMKGQKNGAPAEQAPEPKADPKAQEEPGASG